MWPLIAVSVLFVLTVVGLWAYQTTQARAQRAKLLSRISEGKWRVEQGDRKGGITIFRSVLDSNPSDEVAAEAHFHLANSLPSLATEREAIRQRRLEAASHFQQAIRKNPHHLQARLNLGVLYHDSGRYDDAIGVYRDLLLESPNYAPAYNNIGVTLGAMGNSAQPIRFPGIENTTPLAAFTHAVKLDPEYCQARVNLGNELFDARRFQDATVHYKKAIGIDRKRWDAWSALGNCYRRLGKPREADTAFKQALRWADDAASSARPLYLSGLLPVLPNDLRMARLTIAGELRWADSGFQFQVAQSAAELAGQVDKINSPAARKLSARLKSMAVEQLKRAIKVIAATDPRAVRPFKKRIASDRYLRVLKDTSGFAELVR